MTLYERLSLTLEGMVVIILVVEFTGIHTSSGEREGRNTSPLQS